MARIPFVNNSGRRWAVDTAAGRSVSRIAQVIVSELNGENAFTPLISNCGSDGKCGACAEKEKIVNDETDIENKAKEGTAVEEAGETKAQEKAEDKIANAGTSEGAAKGWMSRKGISGYAESAEMHRTRVNEAISKGDHDTAERAAHDASAAAHAADERMSMESDIPAEAYKRTGEAHQAASDAFARLKSDPVGMSAHHAAKAKEYHGKISNAGTSAGAILGWTTRKAGNDGGFSGPWTATDHVHKNGSVRVVDDDGGGKTVHTFDKNGVKHWSTTVGEGAPNSFLQQAIQHGKGYVEGGLNRDKSEKYDLKPQVSPGWKAGKSSGGSENGFGGYPWTSTDLTHKNGQVRSFIQEEEPGVHTFTPNGMKHWSISFHGKAPKELVESAVRHGKKYIESGKGFTHGGLSNSRISNAGTSEGVKKAWMTRKGGSMSPHDYPIKKLGHGQFEGSTPHGTDFHVRKENGLHTVDIFDSKQKNPDKAHLHTFQEDNEGAAIQAAHEWSRDWKAGKQKGGWSMVPPKGAVKSTGKPYERMTTSGPGTVPASMKYKNSAPDIYERCEPFMLSNTLLPPALQQELDAQVKVDFVNNAGTSEGAKRGWDTRHNNPGAESMLARAQMEAKKLGHRISVVHAPIEHAEDADGPNRDYGYAPEMAKNTLYKWARTIATVHPTGKVEYPNDPPTDIYTKTIDQNRASYTNSRAPFHKLFNAGTSVGAKKGWEVRKGMGFVPHPEFVKLFDKRIAEYDKPDPSDAGYNRMIHGDVTALSEMRNHYAHGKYKEARTALTGRDSAVRDVVPSSVWAHVHGDDQLMQSGIDERKAQEKKILGQHFHGKYSNSASLLNAGTSEGVKKAWETRKGGSPGLKISASTPAGMKYHKKAGNAAALTALARTGKSDPSNWRLAHDEHFKAAAAARQAGHPDVSSWHHEQARRLAMEAGTGKEASGKMKSNKAGDSIKFPIHKINMMPSKDEMEEIEAASYEQLKKEGLI